MAVDVLLGLQWGDEGKGKIVDVLSAGYDLIARFQGGPNAGHTLEFEGKKFVLNTIPSGIFFKNTMNLIGNGVVIDPIALRKELEKLKTAGYDLLQQKNLLISNKAQLILPTHRLLDIAAEEHLGEDKIGATLNGIGPAYMDKAGRSGLPIGSIKLSDFRLRYESLRNKHLHILKALYGQNPEIAEREEALFEAIEYLRQFELVDTEYVVNDYLNQGKRILAEGAQGSMLDVDFGSYPFVTSSTTTSAGACTGLGVAPGKIAEVIGIFKAYATRVGSGPFPTELHDETAEKLRSLGREFGANTGRPRRTGWLDLPALKYTIMLSGVTQLVMTKADILSGFKSITVCTHYNDENAAEKSPVWKVMPGWQADLSEITEKQQLPAELMNYIKFLETELGLPIRYLSVGPDRKQMIDLQINK
jgi:adenylosuccinate synthase